MRNMIVALGVLLIIAVAAPAMAQGPFADVPTDHWAYEAVNDLQQKGIVIGYPDGTFQGRRAITRYEFAVAIARMIGIITPTVAPAGGVSQAELEALRRRVEALEGVSPAQPGSPQVTREEVQSLQRLVNEFRDELAALGVDVDALRRDMAALTERVQAIEARLDRFQVDGNVQVFGISTSADDGIPVDRDNRMMATGDNSNWGNNIGLLFDGDLNVRGRLTPTATANALINYGNYLNYIGVVDDFVGGVRPAELSGFEEVFPYYAYLDMAFGTGDFKVGRLPLQFTPYTLKKIDVDTYSSIMKVDSGDYPVDGGVLNWRLGNVALTGYAAKHNSNARLANGLTSQANGGLFLDGQFHQAGGAAAGGLDSIDQSAGVRALIGTPLRGNLGLTYMRIAGETLSGDYDQADLLGADLNMNWRRFNIGLEYAQTRTLNAGAGADIDDLNKAFDAKVGTTFGGLGLDLGWKTVERNFAAPGYWERLGRWANPTNIEGPYVGLNYGLTSSVKLVANAAMYSGANDIGGLPGVINSEDDDIQRGTLGLKWGISPAWTVDAGAEVIRWKPNGADRSDEAYYTIGAAWQINPSAGLKLAYQIVDYDGSGATTPYGADYKGNLAVAEFGVKF